MLGGGCTVQEYDEREIVAEASAAQSHTNHTLLNGGNTNGGNTNGGNTNGGNTNGGNTNGGNTNGGNTNGTDANIVQSAFDLKTISSVTLDGEATEGDWLKNWVVESMTHHDHVGEGHSILGAEVAGKLHDGSDITLRFDAMDSYTPLGGEELTRYVVSFTRPGSDVRAYVCGKNNDVPIKAIPITGKWSFAEGVPGGGAKTNNPTLVTFACEGFALYKCIDIGYAPWDNEDRTQLADHHQACVRMIRADYCGDGQSWTVNGTLINVYDDIDIQLDTESWPVEAEWDVNGARCLSHQRIQNMETHPTCAFARASATCGDPPQWGPTLLVSEAQ
jgi:hypothetical protein